MPVRHRVEDERLLRGRGCFVDDIQCHDVLHGVVVRSPVAHARIVSVGVDEAKTATGVRAILAREDLVECGYGGLRSITPVTSRSGDPMREPERPILAVDETKYVGEAIAFVIADTETEAQLAAHYQSADIFLCHSEHEGFCIPLIESMAHDMPVVAFAAGAVPETLAGAGILFREKNHKLVAELMGRLTRDQALRTAVVQGQRDRLSLLRNRDLAKELRDHLTPLLGSASDR